jgi:uncharacterized protein involved in propanediol utilization
VITGINGRLHRGLVSLPCDIFMSEATFIPDMTGVVKVQPDWKVKARAAVELVLQYSNKKKLGGLLQLSSNTPMGWGFGSSTSDVTAALRATSDALGMKLDPKEIALLAVKAETASDSIMFNERLVLFAHREGIILEDFGCSIPKLEVLGFNTDPLGAGIDTLSFTPARYSWWEIEAFKPMVGLLRRAAQTQDAALIGQVAAASAYINQERLPKPRFDELRAVIKRVGAVGIQVAHSGTIAGLIFNSKDPQTESHLQQAEEAITGMGFGQTWRFSTERAAIYPGSIQ